MAGFLLCHALGVECCGGQQQASHALSVPEAELVQPRRAGASAVKSQAGSGGGESPVAGIVLSQCPALLSETCLRPGPLEPLRVPTQALGQSRVGRAASGRR